MQKNNHFDLPNLDLTPFVMIIFGGNGDLSRRKLMPALYHLFHAGKIEQFSIIAVGRSKLGDEDYRDVMRDACAKSEDFSEEVWHAFSSNLSYVSLDIEDKNSYSKLCDLVASILDSRETANLIYYLAVPPKSVPAIVGNMAQHRMCRERDGAKIIVEKPFGHNKATAIALNELLLSAFDESQIYRIDHFLGKETVQNILFFRFANSIFEPIWKRNYIERVEITATETLGVGSRGAFYEQAGIIRDMVQNHMLQLVAMIAMEPPVGFAANFIRDEKVKVFRSLRNFSADDIETYTYVAQYGSGEIDGERVVAYREEKGVAEDSVTPTYFAGTFFVDNWRWAGVPFCVRTGKRMHENATNIKIIFKHPPLKLLGDSCDDVKPNVLTIDIKPHEKIGINFSVKRPKTLANPHQVDMVFDYDTQFKSSINSPYERLLLDCMRGDQTLFTRQDGVEATWSIVDPIINYWQNNLPADGIDIYPSGTDLSKVNA